MILVGRASFFGAQESRSSRWRKPRGTRMSTSNFRAVPGRTATTDKTFKATVTVSSGVNPRSSSSFSPTIYTDTRRKSSRKNSGRMQHSDGCCYHRVHGRGAVGRCRVRTAGKVGGGEGCRSVVRGGRQRGEVGHHQEAASSDRRVLLMHWVGEAVLKLDSDQLCH